MLSVCKTGAMLVHRQFTGRQKMQRNMKQGQTASCGERGRKRRDRFHSSSSVGQGRQELASELMHGGSKSQQSLVVGLEWVYIAWLGLSVVS
jgi:hypothetical protein